MPLVCAHTCAEICRSLAVAVCSNRLARELYSLLFVCGTSADVAW